MKESEMEQIAQWIDEAITAHTDDTKLAKIHNTIKDFTRAYPLPGDKS